PELWIARYGRAATAVLHQVVRVCANRARTQTVPADIARDDCIREIKRAYLRVKDPATHGRGRSIAGDRAVYQVRRRVVINPAALVRRVAADGAVYDGQRAPGVIEDAAPRAGEGP